MTEPGLSVVIPCYNAEKWIGRAIGSVLEQGYPNLEIIVIDDGSTDSSLEIIKSFGEKIRWETGRNQGASVARNRGLSRSTSDYVLFLDADDYLAPGSLGAWVRAGAAADIVLGPFAYEYEGHRTAGLGPREPADARSILCAWLEGRYVPPCSVLWRRNFINAIGGWKTHAVRNDDGELAMRAMIDGARVAIAREGLGIYVQHDSPNRVSRRLSHDVMHCELTLFQDLVKRAEARGFDTHVRLCFARAFYRLAYEAFANGLDEAGVAALKEARRHGLKGHVGSVRHRALASILGLRKKLRLSGYVRRTLPRFILGN